MSHNGDKFKEYLIQNENGYQPVQHSLRGLKTNFGDGRTNDDVHISIKMCPLTREIIDTPHMQRLRGLKQLGTSEMTYINTTHCRFEHSLGVAQLAEAVVKSIRTRQPGLEITVKDEMCVKLAGLLHDIGHGPFSHVYDGMFLGLLGQAMEEGYWLGQTIDGEVYEDLPPIMEKWVHEDGSIMMVHALLAYQGLAIDEDHLDEPLKQIGGGIRAECFGLCGHVQEEDGSYKFHDGNTPLPPHRVLTSRDWIFILECIIGGPLPPKGLSVKSANESNIPQKFVGRPHRNLEYLYDVVCNRHSGLDVDKMDYLARDGVRAFGSTGNDTMLIELACVAWGDCPRPMKCFRCKHLDREAKSSGDRWEGKHLMICYPDKMVHNAMNFFKDRFRNHQYLYTHHTTNAAGYMVCDILLLADPFYRGLSTTTEEEDSRQSCQQQPGLRKYDGPSMLPVSRAMQTPESYLRLKDSILDVIAATTKPELRPARALIRRYQSRQLYKRVAEQYIGSSDGKRIDIQWQLNLWTLSMKDIAKDIVKCGQLEDNRMKLIENDIIVEKRQIHHGMGADNPVSCMRFLHKSQMSGLHAEMKDLPIAEKKKEEEYWCTIPRAFLQRTLRIYCRDFEQEKCDFLKTCYYQFIENIKKRSIIKPIYCEDNNINGMSTMLTQSPVPVHCSNDSFAYSAMRNNGTSANERPVRAERKRLFSNLDTGWDST